MNQARWPAFAPLTGVLFVFLAVIAFVVSGEAPGTEDSPQEILDFYLDNRTDQIWAAAFLGWATVAFLFFLGVLTSTLRAVEGAIGRLSTVAFAGGVVLALGMAAFASFTFALGDTVDDGLTPQAAQTLNALNSDFSFPVAVGLGTLMIATGIVIISSRILPAWLGWIALVIGIVAITPLGFFGFLAFLVWTLIVSVLLWRAAAAPAAVPPAPPAT